MAGRAKGDLDGTCVWTTAGDLDRCARGARAGQRPALGGRAGRLRDPRSALPRALRPALQLRADLGPSRRLDLVGPLRGRPAVRRARLRPGRLPSARTPTSCRMPPATRPWASTPCGRCATRSPAWPRPSCCRRATPLACASRTCSAFAATRRPPRRCFAAMHAKGAGRPPDAGHALRAPRHRRLGRRPGELRSAWPSPPATTTAPTARPSTSSRARAGSRRGASARPWRRPAPPRSATSWCTSTGTRPRSTATASAARAGRLATTCSGTRASSSTCTTGTSFQVADGHDFQQVVAAQRRAACHRQRPAHRHRLPHRKGWQYGIEGRASHGAGHKLCSEGFYEALAELTDGAEAAAAQLRARRPALRRARRRRGARGVLLGGAADRAPPARGELPAARALAAGLAAARERLERRGRAAAPGRAACRGGLRARRARRDDDTPEELRLVPGASATLRDALGRSCGSSTRPPAAPSSSPRPTCSARPA